MAEHFKVPKKSCKKDGVLITMPKGDKHNDKLFKLFELFELFELSQKNYMLLTVVERNKRNKKMHANNYTCVILGLILRMGASRLPISFEVNHDESYYIAKWQDGLTDAILVNAYKAFFESQEWIQGYDSFTDLSEWDELGITGNGLRSLATLVEKTFAPHSIHPKIAVYAPHDLPFELSRIYSVGVDTFETHKVFRDKNDALKWLKSSK